MSTSLKSFYSQLCAEESIASFHEENFVSQNDMILLALQSLFDLSFIWLLSYTVSIWIVFIITAVESKIQAKNNINCCTKCPKWVSIVLVGVSYFVSLVLSIIVIARIVTEYMDFYQMQHESYNANFTIASFNDYFCWISIELSAFLMYRNLIYIFIISGITLIDSILIIIISITVSFGSCFTSFLWFFYYFGTLWFVRDNRNDHKHDYEHKIKFYCKLYQYLTWIIGIICCPAWCTIGTLLIVMIAMTIFFGLIAILIWCVGFGILLGLVSFLIIGLVWILIYNKTPFKDVIYVFFLHMIQPCFANANDINDDTRANGWIHKRRKFYIFTEKKKDIINTINLHAAGTVEFEKTLELVVGKPKSVSHGAKSISQLEFELAQTMNSIELGDDDDDDSTQSDQINDAHGHEKLIGSTYFHSKLILDVLLPFVVISCMITTYVSWYFVGNILKEPQLLGYDHLLSYLKLIGVGWQNVEQFYTHFVFARKSLSSVYNLFTVHFEFGEFFGQFDDFKYNLLFLKFFVLTFVSVLRHLRL